MGKTTNTYGLAIRLEEAEAAKITQSIPTTGSVEQKLGNVASGLLKDLAGGGQMIGPEWAERIQSAIDTTDPQSIVQHVERAVNRVGDYTSVAWSVDPTQIAFYQMLADNADITLERQLKSIMDFAFEQGWFNTAAPDVDKILLDREQYRELQQIFKKDIVTGLDVMKLVHKAQETADLSGEEDPLLDALKGE